MKNSYKIRNGLRVAMECSFIYNGDDRMEEGTLWELSQSGWRSSIQHYIAPGTEMTVYLAIPDNGESKYVPVNTAVVRWCHGREAGWEIMKIDAASSARLKAFLEEAGDIGLYEAVCANAAARYKSAG